MSYYADSENFSIDNEEQEFYHGYVSAADEWQVTRSSLFREFTGSIFKPNEKMSPRLAKLNEIVAFSESKDTKKVNKKNYIDDRFSFLQEFIPESIYTKIIETMAFLRSDKKKIAKDISLNIETLATILSLWQLELHASGNFVTEKTLDEINRFLKESSTYSDFRCKGHITSKDIERAEGRILRQLYNQTFDIKEAKKSDNILPPIILTYYQEFMQQMDYYLNEKQKKLLKKKSILPFHVYQLVQKIELMKKILPKVAMDYFKLYIEPEDFVNLESMIDEFYREKNALVGELVSHSIILLEQYYNRPAKFIEMPKKFMTRIKKYRLEFSEEFRLLKEQVACIDKPNLESIEDNMVITELDDQFKNTINNKENIKFIQEINTFKFDSLGLDDQKYVESILKLTLLLKNLSIPVELFNPIQNMLKNIKLPVNTNMVVKLFSLLITISLVLCSIQNLYDKFYSIYHTDNLEALKNNFHYLYLKISNILVNSENEPIKDTTIIKNILKPENFLKEYDSFRKSFKLANIISKSIPNQRI